MNQAQTVWAHVFSEANRHLHDPELDGEKYPPTRSRRIHDIRHAAWTAGGKGDGKALHFDDGSQIIIMEIRTVNGSHLKAYGPYPDP